MVGPSDQGDTVIRFLAALALIAAASGAAAAGFPYDQFTRTTLHALVAPMAQEAAALDGSAPSLIIIDPTRQRDVVHVTYRGQHRPVDAATAAHLEIFEKTLRASNSTAKLYQEEYLFSEGGADYWLPVQAPVAANFDRELKPDDQIDLYIVLTGGLRLSGSWKWVLTVEEFQH
jgi:hypothetical protein